MAVSVPAGDSRLELLYCNPWDRISAVVFIVASLGLCILVWCKRHDLGPSVVVLGAVALVVIFKSSLSLPPVRDDHIPERALAPQELERSRSEE